MIRYSLYDPVSKKYLPSFWTTKEAALKYQTTLVEIYNPKKQGFDYIRYQQYKKIQNKWARHVVRRAKITWESV
jgi:hypothetical protein